MTAMLNALRWDVVIQARNGFYWASAFLVVLIGGLLFYVPSSARTNPAVWVPAILAVNLQITTFFFVAGLMLLERDEGTLQAIAVSPLSSSGYLAVRTLSLTGLAAVETIAIVWIGFGGSGSWPLILAGTAALGMIYTGFPLRWPHAAIVLGRPTPAPRADGGGAERGSKHQRAKNQEVGSAPEQLDGKRVVAHASCGQSYGRCVDGLHEKSDPRSSPRNMTGPELVFESIVPQGIVHHDAYGVPDDRAC